MNDEDFAAQVEDASQAFKLGEITFAAFRVEVEALFEAEAALRSARFNLYYVTDTALNDYKRHDASRSEVEAFIIGKVIHPVDRKARLNVINNMTKGASRLIVLDTPGTYAIIKKL